MQKPLFVISCPIDCYSGYSSRSRDIVKALIRLNKYDIKIIPQRWGGTPFGFLKSENPEHKQILDCILQQPTLPKQPDVWMQITVPNEFQKVGKYNIGITAGIETTICDPSWIEGINRMDLVLVSSNHAKNVFLNSKFEKRDQQTNQILEVIECKVPIEVVFEGIDQNIYKKLETSKFDLSEIKEDFCMLFCGHWLSGELGQDRKDVGGLIKTFLETFRNKKQKPALILKTSGATYSIMDRDDMLNRIQHVRNMVDGDLPNIYLLHGELTDEEMNELYNHPKVKCFVSFSKGEGYGRPLLEASIAQKPIITTGWSGHTDFLSPDFSTLLPGQLTQIHPSAVVPNMLIPESGWFTVDYKTASRILEDIYKNPSPYFEKAKRQAYRSRTQFSLDKMAELLDIILEDKVPKIKPIIIPQISKLNLPKIIKNG
ncbi:MAG TPA: glycosyltransferase [Nitrososphaeraceae archaeon]|nr:glycosyltransferase [Nitrososphaeraceae archaeon]